MHNIKPRIGLLGITQELYDDVVEGIEEYPARANRLEGMEYG